jgi:predicted alpha/beta hydrolase
VIVRPETIEIRTRDGQTLFADVREPAAPPRGVAILSHAMFARRTEFERPARQGLSELVSGAGYVTVAFDFRGHGDSVPRADQGGDWSYDDLVQRDLPAVASCARGRFPNLPLVVIGHSLGGHVALAAQAIDELAADALVLIASNVWMKQHESSRRTWFKKRIVAEALELLSLRRGYLPSRMLRLGSDDEAGRYMASLTRTARRGRWTSDDGRFDYGELSRKVNVPVATVASERDRFMCSPECAERLIERTRGPRYSERVRCGDDGSPAPGHMGLVTSGKVREVYRRVLSWVEGELGAELRSA